MTLPPSPPPQIPSPHPQNPKKGSPNPKSWNCQLLDRPPILTESKAPLPGKPLLIPSFPKTTQSQGEKKLGVRHPVKLMMTLGVTLYYQMQIVKLPTNISVIRKVTLSSRCLWACFHPLSPLSVGICKVMKFYYISVYTRSETNSNSYTGKSRYATNYSSCTGKSGENTCSSSGCAHEKEKTR
jgi:hypothetical protein